MVRGDVPDRSGERGGVPVQSVAHTDAVTAGHAARARISAWTVRRGCTTVCCPRKPCRKQASRYPPECPGAGFLRMLGGFWAFPPGGVRGSRRRHPARPGAVLGPCEPPEHQEQFGGGRCEQERGEDAASGGQIIVVGHRGNSLTIRSSGNGRTLSYCLAKNGTNDRAHWSRRERIHARSIGRRCGPLSPPAMTQ